MADILNEEIFSSFKVQTCPKNGGGGGGGGNIASSFCEMYIMVPSCDFVELGF